MLLATDPEYQFNEPWNDTDIELNFYLQTNPLFCIDMQ